MGTSIEWTDETWNPIRARDRASGKVGWGCVKVSPACANCYAERQNKAGFAGGTRQPYTQAGVENVEFYLDEKTLLAPLRWKRPRKIFPCSMTDLFGAWVPDEWLAKIYAVMALASQHTFQVLTKRAKRRRRWSERITADELCEAIEHVAAAADIGDWIYDEQWPLRNVWEGVTAENQERFEERTEELILTPAAIRFLSCEPLLGPLDLPLSSKWSLFWERIHWVIAGGESGPGARPMHPDWARSLRDQCKAAGVPFFFKQWGEWRPFGEASGWDMRLADKSQKLFVQPDGSVASEQGNEGFPYARVGKHDAGRLLDGREWNEMPEVAR